MNKPATFNKKLIVKRNKTITQLRKKLEVNCI